MAFCSNCGTQLLEGSAFCSRCGRGTSSVAPISGSSPGLSDNAAGALAYVTIIPAILFLLIDPYKQKPFVRFHAFQSIFFCVTAFAVGVALSLIPFLGFFGWASLLLLVRLGFFVIWVVLVVKASQGKIWELPVIGALAKQQAGSQGASGPGQAYS